VGSTVTASGLTEPGLAGDARALFDRMAEAVVCPDQLANQIYLVEMVLPASAFLLAGPARARLGEVAGDQHGPARVPGHRRAARQPRKGHRIRPRLPRCQRRSVPTLDRPRPRPGRLPSAPLRRETRALG
jgi:hypothetical protein